LRHNSTNRAQTFPDDVLVLGTIRTFKLEVRAKMLAGIERTAKAVAAMSDAPAPDIKITEGAKAVMNDPGGGRDRREGAEGSVR
jgi:metal-dependent amidase/aminoacylase/carboxypeptidase family protein